MVAARGRCDDIAAKYEAVAQEEYWKLIKDGGKELEQQVQRIGSSAGMEVKKSVLAMKQSYVDKVLEKSVDAICGLPEEQYTAFLSRFAAQAALSGTEELVFSAADRDRYGKAVCGEANALLEGRGIKGALTVSDDVGSFRGGVVVRQGDIDVNCTVEKLVEMSRSELAPKIASILFDE